MRHSPFPQKVSDEMMRRRYAKRIMGDAEVEAFLDHMVLQREVAGRKRRELVRSPFSRLGVPG